jgi:hypothetical protein
MDMNSYTYIHMHAYTHKYIFLDVFIYIYVYISKYRYKCKVGWLDQNCNTLITIYHNHTRTSHNESIITGPHVYMILILYTMKSSHRKNETFIICSLTSGAPG